MLENGYIKLYRSIANWRWYDDPITKLVFIHLLLTVSIKDSKWHDETIRRGERIISYQKLSEELHVSVRSVRTALDHLKATGEVTVRKHPKYSVVTVQNFEKYQQVPDRTPDNRQGTDNQPSGYRQQYKKVEEDSKKEKEKSGAPAQYSPEEWEALKARLRR